MKQTFWNPSVCLCVCVCAHTCIYGESSTWFCLKVFISNILLKNAENVVILLLILKNIMKSARKFKDNTKKGWIIIIAGH